MRYKNLLDPLFDRKIFTVACLVLLASITTYLVLFTNGLHPDSAPESAEAAPNVGSTAEAETAYEVGFQKGFDAFMRQTGRGSRFTVSKSYTSSESVQYDEEEINRGYVDGYHRATEVGSCPRSF